MTIERAIWTMHRADYLPWRDVDEAERRLGIYRHAIG